MFFPSVAMPCISHPLYFTRYKAKLFLFISCRERRLGEDPNLLSAIKVPISSFLDSINRTNKFVFILYLIGLGEIVYLVTLCWVFGIQKIFLSSFNISSYSCTLFIYVTMNLQVFSFLCPPWCFLCLICLVLTLYHHVHLFIPPPFSISPGSLHFIDMTNTSTQSSPALNITMLFLSHHSYTLHWSHLIQNCLNKLCIKVILLNIHHVIISVARGGFTYLSYYSHWSPITNTLCYAITFSPLMTFRAQFLNYYGWHLLHSRNLEVYFTFASSSPFNHKLHIWSKFSDRTRWPKTYIQPSALIKKACAHTHTL